MEIIHEQFITILNEKKSMNKYQKILENIQKKYQKNIRTMKRSDEAKKMCEFRLKIRDLPVEKNLKQN